MENEPESSPRPLEELRKLIDAADAKIIEQLNLRAEYVVEVGQVKRKTGSPIYAPDREAQVLKRVRDYNKGPLPNRTIEAIYRELMSGSFRLEQPLRIGYVGPKGNHNHLASTRQFGLSVEYEDLRVVEGVFTEIIREHVDYGLVPIENSSGGGVSETMDAFSLYHNDVRVYGEIQLEVNQCLLSNSKPPQITRIFTSHTGYTQCRKWLATQYPKAEIVTVESSAKAAQIAKKEAESFDIHTAAIGSQIAGDIYGLHLLFQNIEDEPNNITRYLILSKESAKISEHSKTSIMFVTDDRPGALVDVLNIFKDSGINLTHIDKRPSGRVNWEYKFFIDAVGHCDDPNFRKVLEKAGALCKELTDLGSYPRSTRVL